MDSYLNFFVFACVLAGIAYAMWPKGIGFQKIYRDSEEGLPDLLRYYRPAKDGVILGKNGELIGGFFFRGVDLDSSSNAEIMGIMTRLNTVLCRFGTGWMLHCDAVRGHAIGYPKESKFPHPVLRAMDLERRLQFTDEGQHYDSQYAVIVTWLPPTKRQLKAESLMYEHSDDVGQEKKDLSRATLAEYENRLAEFQIALENSFHNVTRMKRSPVVTTEPNGAKHVVDELISYLHFCITGIPQKIRVSLNNVCDVDYLVGSYDFVGGARPRVGKMNIRVVSIEGFPSESAPLMLEQLDRLPVRFRWSSRYIFEDSMAAKNRFNKIRDKWKQQTRPVMDQLLNNYGGAINSDAINMVADTEGALNEVASGLVRYGDYTSVIVLMDESQEYLDEQARRLDSFIRELNFQCRIEEVNAVEAFLGSLPGHGYENCRKWPINTLNLAYLFPSSATWSGLPAHPCKFYPPNSPPLAMANAAGGTPFGLCLHYDDLGHFIGVGPTGSGKSTLCTFLEAQHFRYPDASIFLFEKGYSGFALCSASGGRHYDIGSDSFEGGFAPLADVDLPSERIWAEEWLTECLALQGHDVTPRDLKTIRAALLSLANSPREQRQMTVFISYLQDSVLKASLEFYAAANGNQLLDAAPDEEKIELSFFTVFEMEHLMQLGEKRLVPVLRYLFHKIERSLNGGPAFIILDEAWLMLSHPLFREKIKEWLKTLRKMNVGVGFYTQEIVDLLNSPIRDVIFSACQVRILLANREAGTEEQRPLYKALGCNDAQISVIEKAVRKQDYYYMSPYGNRLFQLSLGQMNLAFAGVSGKTEVEAIRLCQSEYGERWPVEWTRRRAGDQWSKVLDSFYTEAAA